MSKKYVEKSGVGAHTNSAEKAKNEDKKRHESAPKKSSPVMTEGKQTNKTRYDGSVGKPKERKAVKSRSVKN